MEYDDQGRINAGHVEISSKVNAFRQYKALQQVNAPRVMQDRELKKSGLFNDNKNLLKAESYIAESRTRELNKENLNNQIHKGNKIGKRSRY